MKSAIIVLMVDPIAEMIYVWCMQLLIKKKNKNIHSEYIKYVD